MIKFDYPSCWVETTLGDICYINRNSLSEKEDSNCEFKYIDLSSVDNGKIIFPKKCIKFKDAPIRARRIMCQNDIIMSTVRPNLKGFAFIDFDASEFICSTGFAVLTVKQGISSKFIYQTLYSSNFEQQIKNMLVGSNYPSLNSLDVASIKLFLPPLAEQEKIAEILGTWDSAIEKLTALIAAKRLQKKGLIYSYVKKAKDTETFMVSDLFDLGRGKVISKNEIEKKSGIYPVFSSQTSNDGILGYINSFDYDGEFITWTTDGANAGRVFFRKGKFNCTNVCGLASLKKDINLNLYYAMTYLNLVTKYYVSYVGNPKLMNNAFASIPIQLPSISYQNKVSDILSKADEEIDLLTRKLDLLQSQKKGLMQQLLTGKIRVKVA